MDLAKYEFKRKLQEIKSISGSATELISLYVPPSKQISDVVNYLRNEYAQSSNIKSKSTRKNVMWAIESIIGKLKQYRKPPANGVVFFVGNKSVGDKTEEVSYIIEPIEPITTFLYRCDSFFYTEFLDDMIVEKEEIGLIVVDRKEATLGVLKGKRIVMLKNIQSQVPSKHRMGGQSAQRFERLIEETAHQYFVKVSDVATNFFLNRNLRGILIGGPGPTKDFFVEEEFLHHELRKKVVGTFNVGYTDEYGLRELVENAKDALQDLEFTKEKKVVENFMKEIIKENGLSVYGEEEVRKYLSLGTVDTLLLSEGLKKYRIKAKCSCGNEEQKTVEKLEINCSKCNSKMQIVEKEDIIEELNKLAEQSAAKVELISTETAEGEMFFRAFGGIGVVLRYRG